MAEKKKKTQQLQHSIYYCHVIETTESRMITQFEKKEITGNFTVADAKCFQRNKRMRTELSTMAELIS